MSSEFRLTMKLLDDLGMCVDVYKGFHVRRYLLCMIKMHFFALAETWSSNKKENETQPWSYLLSVSGKHLSITSMYFSWVVKIVPPVVGSLDSGGTPFIKACKKRKICI